MAATRRRSRISDTAAAPVHHYPQPASPDDGANGASVDAPMNRATTAVCRRCQSGVGEFYNAWHKITGSYFLPAMLASYSSRLRDHGKQKMAAKGTELDGCLIQPLSCPGPGCTDNLGLRVVDSTEAKQAFRARHLFKLSRIELRCNIADDNIIVVEPQVDPEPLAIAHSETSSPPVPANPPPPDGMEVDTRPLPPPLGPLHPRHEQHHDHLHLHHHHRPPHQSYPSHPSHHAHHAHGQSLQQAEPNRQTLPPPPPVRSPTTPLPLHSLAQKSPSTHALPSPAVKPVHDVPYSAAPKDAPAALTNRTRELPPASHSHSLSHAHSHSHSPAEQQQQQHRTNGQYYPRPPQDVQLDAIERLQTQISQNSGAISAHGRNLQRCEDSLQHQEDSLRREFQGQLQHQHLEIRRVDDAVGRLHNDVVGIHKLLENLTREVHAVREVGELQGPRVAGGPTVQDSAIELMAQQVAVISQRANEIDTLKITIEIMKNKIQRLEEAAAPAPQPNAPVAPSYHGTPSAIPHVSSPVHATAQRPQPYHSHSAPSIPVTPEVAQGTETPQAQNGWVTVNASAKRAHPNGLDTHDGATQSIGSPKRPKLTPLEPRAAYTPGHQHVYEHMDTDDSDARIQSLSHSLPSQTLSHESAHDSTLASQHSAFVAYGTQEGPSDDSWRSESQRTSKGRGRGGGPGSRGGRVRKSLPAQVHQLATPEWERDDWQSITDSQTSPDGYYNHARSGTGILRRGGGGGGGGGGGSSARGRPSSSGGRAMSLGLQGMSTGVAMPGDPYAHTKKTRTKPVRNADGILIRKDGRPDMRSQSSAANLRKVHARKDEQKEPEPGFTPANFNRSKQTTETPSPTGYLPPGQDVTASVQKKHTAIMDKMFPGGVDEATKEHNYSRKVFDESKDHTAQTRSQHHHQASAQSPLDMKSEQRRLSGSQSSSDGDVDMDGAEDHADDEGQTPSGQSDNSGGDSQYHDARNPEEQQHTENEPKENGVQAPSSAQSVATREASPTQAA